MSNALTIEQRLRLGRYLDKGIENLDVLETWDFSEMLRQWLLSEGVVIHEVPDTFAPDHPRPRPRTWWSRVLAVIMRLVDLVGAILRLRSKGSGGKRPDDRNQNETP